MPDRPRNVGASVRQRLLNLAHARGQPMELLLTRYALERLLHRLGLSPHRERFVLKGAMLLATWFDEPHRATRDVDLLGFGEAAADALLDTFREIMAVEVDDGVIFDLKGSSTDTLLRIWRSRNFFDTWPSPSQCAVNGLAGCVSLSLRFKAPPD